MKMRRGAVALLVSLSLTACTGIIPAAPERASEPVRVDPPPPVEAWVATTPVEFVYKVPFTSTVTLIVIAPAIAAKPTQP